MSKMLGEIKFASITFIVLGIFFGIIMTILTVFGGSLNLLWIITILPTLVLITLFFVSGIGIRYGKRWVWWLTQIYCLIFSYAFLRVLIEQLLIYKDKDKVSTFSRALPIFLIIPTINYLLFSKDSMKYFKFEGSSRKKAILKALIIPA